MKAFLTTIVAGFLIAGVAFADSRSQGPMHSGSTHDSMSSRQGLKRSPQRGTMVASNQPGAPLRATRFNNTRKFDRDYHLTHGRSFQYGYFYPGRSHYHWTHYCWWPRFGCYTYWCPSTSCYYYYSETASCYYPVSYAETVTPTASNQLIDINVNNNNNNNNTNVVNAAPTVPTAVPVPVPTPVGPPAPPTRAVVRSTVGLELPPPTE
jgi:hypothetical protein